MVVPGAQNVLKRQETSQLNHLAKLSKVVYTRLNLLQAVAHDVTLHGVLEERVAHRALEEKKIGHCGNPRPSQAENLT